MKKHWTKTTYIRFDSYEDFYNHVSKLPRFAYVKRLGLTLNRIDNEGHYEKGNLEWASHSKQTINTSVRADSKSGVRGVTWNSRMQKWYATITLHGKHIHLGSSHNKDKATKIRKKAEKEYFSTALY